MSTEDRERERMILDATAELLLRIGYNKLTMGDVAEATSLHRGLVYLVFKSKDELVEAVVHDELGRYADAWREQLETGPRAGSVASVYRAMMGALKTLPLAAAIVARAEDVFGKYLRKRGNVFERLPEVSRSHDFLRAMQEAGAVRREVDVKAVAYILDALTPAIRRTFQEPADDDVPSSTAVLAVLENMIERALPPAEGADLAAGKTILLNLLTSATSEFNEAK
ncbi:MULTISPECIES: TetR/AcrR family transcriptional regulator [unclassified Nonomuraea]|uniref:TetR/AcrR family transcriptional regulator n=1 Tax=unclassified Nonomuraea TaxID=2593643 RepID=UPI0033E4B81B